MDPEMVVETIQFWAQRPRQAVEPVIEAMLDLLDTAGVAGGGQGLPASGQIDGLLQKEAQRLKVRLFLSGDDLVEVLAAAEQVAVATALGDFEHIVTFQAIHDQVAIEVGAEDVFGDVVPPAGANSIDRHVLGTE